MDHVRPVVRSTTPAVSLVLLVPGTGPSQPPLWTRTIPDQLRRRRHQSEGPGGDRGFVSEFRAVTSVVGRSILRRHWSVSLSALTYWGCPWHSCSVSSSTKVSSETPNVSNSYGAKLVKFLVTVCQRIYTGPLDLLSEQTFFSQLSISVRCVPYSRSAPFLQGTLRDLKVSGTLPSTP